MAKKEKGNELDNLDDGEKKGGGSKLVTIIIALVIVIIWLGIFALLIKLDVGGFGSGVLKPILKDVPIINRILPASSDDEVIGENNYPYKNISEAVKKIKELELQLDSLTKNNSADGTYISDLESEIARLKVFEENQTEFKKKEKEFDTNVVFAKEAPSIEEYAKYYEGINPDNAAEIYRQVVEQMQYDNKIIEQAKRYAKMEPAAAAEILEIMSSGDLDVVCGILSNMKEEQSALIMAQLDPATSAKITKKMTMGE